MDRRLIEMLICTILFSLIFGIPPAEKERIRKLYEDSYHKIDVFLKTAFSKNNEEWRKIIEKHCFIAKIHIKEYVDRKYKHKKVTLIDSNVSVTFDDLEHIKVPGVIRCTYRNDDVTEDEDETNDADDIDNKLIYSLVLTEIYYEDHFNFDLVTKDTENNNNSGGLLFLSDEALRIRNLKNSYKTDEKYEEMEDWLQNNKDNINTVELCEFLILKGEFEFVIDVLSAEIEMERVHLSLDENQSVDVPGLLLCKIKHQQIALNHIFFAKYGLNHDKHSYLPVYLSRNESADGKCIFVLEYYRINNTAQTLS